MQSVPISPQNKGSYFFSFQMRIIKQINPQTIQRVKRTGSAVPSQPGFESSSTTLPVPSRQKPWAIGHRDF